MAEIKRFTKEYVATNGKKASISIWTGEEDEAFATSNITNEDYVPSSAPSLDDSLKLAGLLSSEVIRYKEKLMNDTFSSLDNSIEIPTVPTTSPLILQMKVSNELKKQKETREILIANVDKEYKKTDIQIKLRELQLKESQNSIAEGNLAMNGNFYVQNEKMIAGFDRLSNNIVSVRDNLTNISEKLENSVNEQITSNAQIIAKMGEYITALNNQTTAIENQELSLSGDMSANVSIDVTPLANANNIIASGVENQINTNAKIVENITKLNDKLDFEKNGIETLKDSKGNIIKPRESKALKSAEDSILSKDKNTFDSTKAIIEPLEKMLLDEKNLDSQTSSGFGDFELKSVLSEILNVDKTKFDFEYRTKLYSNDDPEGVK
jgi:hypothetical protein